MGFIMVELSEFNILLLGGKKYISFVEYRLGEKIAPLTQARDVGL